MMAYKWWRVTQVRVRSSSLEVRTVAELAFHTKSGVLSDDPLRVTGSSLKLEAKNNLKAFDQRPETYASSPTSASSNTDTEISGLGWFLAYEFEEPQVVDSVTAQMRVLDSAYIYEEWQTAELEASHDGLIWEPVGKLQFSIPARSVASIRVPLLLAPADKYRASLGIAQVRVWEGVPSSHNPITPIPNLGLYKVRFPYSDYASEKQAGVGEGGYISGIVYERIGDTAKKVPVSRAVYLYRQDTGALVMRTWSNEQGEYLFNKIALGLTFMIVSVDHTGQWGLEGAAFKKAKRRDTSGLPL